MTTDYERHLIVSYLANTARRLHHRDRAAQALAEWVMDSEDGGASRAGGFARAWIGRTSDPDEKLSGGDWRSFRRALRDECAVTGRGQPDLTARRLQRLAETTGLNRTDVAILELMLRYHTEPIIESMIDEVLLRSAYFERLATRTLRARSFLPCSVFPPARSATGFPIVLRW